MSVCLVACLGSEPLILASGASDDFLSDDTSGVSDFQTQRIFAVKGVSFKPPEYCLVQFAIVGAERREPNPFDTEVQSLLLSV